MSEPLELETYRKITVLLAKNPGLGITSIAEQLNIKLTVLQQYLESMQRHNEIDSAEEQGVIRYYLRDGNKLFSQQKRTDDIRLQMYTLISHNPGLHLSKIAKLLRMSVPLAKYHLESLEKENFIIAVMHEKRYYKRYYVKDSNVGVDEKQIISLLRQEYLLKIVLLLYKHGRLKHGALLEGLDIAPATLSYHLTKLVNHGVINVSYFGLEKGYSLKDEKKTIWIVRKYKFNKIFEGFSDLCSEMRLSEEKDSHNK